MSIQKREKYDPKKEKLKYLKRKISPNYVNGWKIWKEKYPEKYKARYTLRNSVRLGKILRKPCEICGDEKSQAHHEDYSKPLEVIWLCTKHHKEKHYGNIKDMKKRLASLTPDSTKGKEGVCKQ